VAFIVFVIVLTSWPYASAYFHQSNDLVFTGFLFGVEDGNSYIAKMLLGAQGEWLFRSPYTAIEQRGALLYLPYLILGKVLGPQAQHAQLVLLFHLFRSFSIAALCYASYEFVTHFIHRVVLRRLALAFVTLGNGLGWLLLFVGSTNWLGSLPLDFYSPETFGFLSVYGLPHLALARALFLWGLLIHLRAPQTLSRPWLISLLWLCIALTHLLSAGLGLFLIGTHLVLLFVWQHFSADTKWPTLKPNAHLAGWAALGASPVFIYNGIAYLRGPYLQAWAIQNQILSPHPLHYLLAYGWLLPFAYFGLRGLLETDRRAGSFFLIWLLVLPFLLYAPLGLQRRLAEAAWVMMILLSLKAFEDGFWMGKARALGFFTLAFPSTLILLLGGWGAAARPTPPIFRPQAEIAAFEELRQRAQPGEVVLASYSTSNGLPAWAPLRVLIGHGPESVGLATLLPQVNAFYGEFMTQVEREQFLNANGIDYVFWGLAERSLGVWTPGGSSNFDLLFEMNGYAVYRVIDK